MAGAGGFGSWRHLAVRFFGALSPAGPAPADEAWALGFLVPGEQALWRRMSGPDRRHAVGVARDAGRLLGGEPPRPVMAAALLHDVGKVESGFGTFARVGVTLAAVVVGRERLAAWGAAAPAGHAHRALRRRVGLYLTHDRLGAELLTAAGSEPLTVAWTTEHHLDPARWSLEPAVARALKDADGD